MTDKHKRIMLAEAMDIDPHGDGMVFGKRWEFDPFTDANDDYAVLEWMRKSNDTWVEIEQHLETTVGDPVEYQIGDYARAAIAVLEGS